MGLLFLAGLGKRVAGVARAAGTGVWSGLEQGSLLRGKLRCDLLRCQ